MRTDLGLLRTFSPLDGMKRDKKTRGDLLRFVVLEGVGRPTRLEGPDPALLAEVQKRSAPIIEDWVKKASAKGVNAKAALADIIRRERRA